MPRRREVRHEGPLEVLWRAPCLTRLPVRGAATTGKPRGELVQAAGEFRWAGLAG
jgi:hypothetical protein